MSGHVDSWRQRPPSPVGTPADRHCSAMDIVIQRVPSRRGGRCDSVGAWAGRVESPYILLLSS